MNGGPNGLKQAVEAAIVAATAQAGKIVKTTPTSGGCINDTCFLLLSDGRRYFLKSNRQVSRALFETETLALNAIRATETIRVPDVVVLGQSDEGESFLVLEAIESGHRPENFFANFGHRLAEMHRTGMATRFGFETDNFLGSTSQPNSWMADWEDFWVTQRWEFQIRLAQKNGFGDSIMPLASRFESRMRELIRDVDERPALVHGDLWSGNYLVDDAGLPVLIDPAAYYAQRESELGMTTLFGGFPSAFYDAYQESWPLSDGWEQRVEIYRLYHLLNHLNLFGHQYLSACIEIMKKIW